MGEGFLRTREGKTAEDLENLLLAIVKIDLSQQKSDAVLYVESTIVNYDW
jgi:hypothetical protein